MEMADGDRFTPEQAEALSALRDGRNVFLSGNAGTGKSYVLNAFISDLKARNVDFLALAPTGIAALNLTDGSTIHRTLKIAPGVCAPDGPKGSRKVLDAAKVIIIDEISMCRIDLFDHVMGMISQSMTRNGAKQVVLVGDFFQLPPVVTERDSALLMKFYPGNLQGWCFKSRYWTGFDFEPHVLKTVVRQSDPDFIDNLNRARVGDASCLDYFNAHSKSSRAYLPKDTLVLCANNRIADSINRENVDALDAPKVEFAAAATGTVSNGDKMAPERIVLCRGARVMSLVNSPQEGYVNGTQGTVTDASADAVTVKFDGVDEKVRIERHRWEINKSEAVVEMGDAGTSSPFAPQQSAQASVDGISIDRVTIEEGTGPDGKPFRYIRVAYTFENVTDSDAVAPYTDINAYQDGIKLDRSYKVQDQRAQKQIEPGGKLKSFTAFAPDSETVPVTVKVMAPGEKEPRSERCYCIVNPGLQ